MSTILTVLIIIVSILLILIVLVQNPKGGGLSSTFAGSNQVMGVRKTADFLEKSSWTLAIVLVVLCFMSTLVTPKDAVHTQKSLIESKIQDVAPNATPDFSTLPVEQPADSTK